jgi:tyrosyl-tRNA synthetase
MTKRIHGAEALARAESAAAALFSGATAGADFASSDGDAGGVHRLGRLRRGMPIVDVLVRAKLASSKGGDARRGIEGRGFYLGGDAITDAGPAWTWQCWSGWMERWWRS